MYSFANGSGPGRPTYLIGSADLMPRNLDRRVEVLVSLESAEQQARLWEILSVALDDDHLAWSLGSDGVWRRVPPATGVDTHRRLQDLARHRALEVGRG